MNVTPLSPEDGVNRAQIDSDEYIHVNDVVSQVYPPLYGGKKKNGVGGRVWQMFRQEYRPEVFDLRRVPRKGNYIPKSHLKDLVDFITDPDVKERAEQSFFAITTAVTTHKKSEAMAKPEFTVEKSVMCDEQVYAVIVDGDVWFRFVERDGVHYLNIYDVLQQMRHGTPASINSTVYLFQKDTGLSTLKIRFHVTKAGYSLPFRDFDKLVTWNECRSKKVDHSKVPLLRRILDAIDPRAAISIPAPTSSPIETKPAEPSQNETSKAAKTIKDMADRLARIESAQAAQLDTGLETGRRIRETLESLNTKLDQLLAVKPMSNEVAESLVKGLDNLVRENAETRKQNDRLRDELAAMDKKAQLLTDENGALHKALAQAQAHARNVEEELARRIEGKPSRSSWSSYIPRFGKAS